MQPNHLTSQIPRLHGASLAATPASDIPRLMRPSKPLRRALASLALGLAGFVGTAQATLLVYEGFNYTVVPGTGTLHGQTGGTGFDAASAWNAANTGSYPNNSPTGFAICDSTMDTLWNGTVTSVPQTGKFAGSPAPAWTQAGGFNGNNPDHQWAWRALDSTVTTSFTPGSTTWMGYVEASNFKNNSNSTGGMLAIGSGYFGNDTRGDRVINGTAVGIGINYGAKIFTAAVWTGSTWADNAQSPQIGPSGGTPFTNGSDRKAQIGLAKIVWGDASNPTTIKVCAFTDGATLTEAAFDSSSTLVTNTVTIDPTTVTYLSLGGGRFDVDELRIGTTFNDAIGVVVAATGNYWAPGLTGGGTGTWNSASNVWATGPAMQGTGGQASAGALVFSGATGTVTIDGTVSAAAGLQFLTDTYSIVPGASSPDLSLTGATATDNTLSVNSGQTATVGVTISGTTGMTKDGSGTLVLSGIGNTYGGGTVLNAGSLQIAALGSLGSGSVTFEGGTLQYPPGSGASALDVSARIASIATGKVAKIDTNGNDVTFGTDIGGDGGLTKLGAGSLTLGAANSYTGLTTVSGGTLNIDTSSGTVATLNVPAGGTVNLGPGATITTLNITGGTVNITGTGVHINTLVATSGAFDASSFPLTVSGSAVLGQTKVTRTGGSSFTLGGANLVAPTSVSHRTITASSGTLAFTTTGLDAAIGIAQPGAPALPTTATFGGSGAWTLNGGAATEFGNFYGQDNHAFHYMQVASGDFDISVHVTTATNAEVGLMARDSLAASSGDWVGIWTGRSAYALNGVLSQGGGPGGNRWFRIARVGNLVTSYHGPDGTTWTQAQQLDCSSHPWGPTTYLGLGLANTSGPVGSAVGGYDNVNFMGDATLADMETTDLLVDTGAMLDLGFSNTAFIGALTLGGVAESGTWGSSLAAPAPEHVNDIYFSIAGAGKVFVVALPTAPGGLAATPGDNKVTLSWSAEAAARSYTVKRRDSGIGSYNVIGTAGTAPSPSYTDATAVNGTPYDYVVSASNSLGEGPDSTPVTATPVAPLVTTPFASWITGYYPTPSDPDAAPDADPDGDGLKNSVEYVLGALPNASNQGGPSGSTSGGNFIFTFQRALASKDADTAVAIEVSTNLGTWDAYDVGASPVVITPGLDAEHETVTLTLARSPDAMKFARLRVAVTAAP